MTTNWMSRIWMLVFLLLSLPSGAMADSEPTDGSDSSVLPEYTIRRASEEIVVDGKLDEANWKAARRVGDFQFPWWTSGAKEPTEAKLLWDDSNLYVSYRCQDAHIWGEHLERDSPVYRDDCVEVFTAPNPLRPNDYFNIEMNVRGAFLDQHHPEGPRVPMKEEWNGSGIRIAVTVEGTLNDDDDRDMGWVLEAAIPFSNFAGVAATTPPTPDQVWHVNLNRLGGKTNPQFSQWSRGEVQRRSFHVPENFGRMVFSASPASGG